MPDAERGLPYPSCSCVPDFPVVLRLLNSFRAPSLRLPPCSLSPIIHFIIRLLVQSV